PQDGAVFKLVSWNLQTYGKRIKADRKRASADAIARIFGDGTAKVFAAQEIANETGAELVERDLDAGKGRWTKDFQDSSDAQDNVVAGDFNLPTRAGKGQSRRAGARGWTPIEDVLDAHVLRGRFKALVDEPTSREDGEAANNYDHFLVSSHLLDTAFVRGSA